MKKIFFFFLLFCSSIYSQTTNRGGEVETDTKETGKTHVILIGVSEYSFLPEDQQLDFADDDAQLFHDFIKTWGNNEVKVFLNEEAAQVNQIGMELQNTLLSEAKSGDRVIIFFAGHGDVDKIYGDGYLLLNKVKPANNSTYRFNEALSLNDLRQMVDRADLNGVEVMLIADACRSGSVLSADANTMMSSINKNSITMVSCQHNQFSEESIKYGNGHGVFTYYLIQGMMGLADVDDNKIVSLKELRNYVEDKLSAERQGEQTPDFKGLMEKEVVIVNDKLLAEAKKQDNLSLAITALGKKKAITAPFEGVSSKCQSLMQLLIEQTAANKFFNDELDLLDQQTLAIGQVNSKKMHSGAGNAVAISSNGRFAASGGADGLSIYENQDLKNAVRFKEHNCAVTAVDFSDRGNLLVSGGADGSLIMWNPSTGERLGEINKMSSEITTLEFLSENQLIVGTLKGTIQVIDLEAKTEKQLKAHKGRVTDLEYKSPHLYSAGDDGKICVFDLTSNKKILTIPAHEGRVTSLKILELSNAILSVGDDGKLKKWQLNTLKQESSIEIGFADLNSIEVDPYEKFCLIGSKEKKVGLVDLGTRSVLKSKMANTSGVRAMSYDPISYTLAMVEYDGSVTFQKIKVNPDLNAAVDLHRQLLDCGDLSKYKYKIDGTLIIGLNNSVSAILNPLVNGDKLPVDLEEIRKGIRYAEKAFELGKDYVNDAKKLEINLLLLEVYEIMAMKDKTKYPEAIEKLKRIEELDPKGAYGFNVTAQLYAQMNDLEKAKAAIQKAEALAPQWSEVSCNSGVILALSGDTKGAETKFKETIQNSPDLVKGYANLGSLYLSQGKFEDAKKQLEKAIALDSNNAKVNQDYLETLSKIQAKPAVKTAKTTTKKLEDYGKVITNSVFYYGYQNRVKFVDSKLSSQIKITTDFGTLANVGDDYLFVPKAGGAKTAKLNFTEIATGALLGSIELPLKNMPQPQLFWGKSKVDEYIDLSARVFVFGYKNEADLNNLFYKVVNYEVLFVDGGITTEHSEFNPASDPDGMLSYNGNGPEIYQELIDEITQRKSRGVTGKVCVAATVESPQGVRYKTSACFWY